MVYFTAPETAKLHAAEEKAVQRCMRENGFSYTPTPSPVDRWEPDNPYGLLGENQSRVEGYGITPRILEQPENTAPPQSRFPTEARGYPSKKKVGSETWQRALLGTRQQTVDLPGGGQVLVPENGCVAESRRKLYGADWERLYYLFQTLSNRVITEVTENSYVRAAQTRWAECMAEDGYAVATMEEARARVTRKVEDADRNAAAVRTAVRTELRTALADARCQQKVSLRRAFQTAQEGSEQKLLSQYAPELHRLRTLRNRAVAKASAETDADADGPVRTEGAHS
ncbi:hypothetical protein [Streptomyces ardesiacus]|uniref:hypothetical protein n=1 Tax=Streptomyces ardesiacus TaxID=285564 RepID=UPI0036C3491F